MATDGEEKKGGGGEKAAATAQQQVRIKWDDTNMRSAYSNVCNVTGTREEIVFLFGMNQSWYPGQKEMTVQLTDRIVMSPFAAKRLVAILSNVVSDYESRYGALDAETQRPAGTTLS